MKKHFSRTTDRLHFVFSTLLGLTVMIGCSTSEDFRLIERAHYKWYPDMPWTCVVPDAMEGRIDTNLAAGLHAVDVCAGDAGQVGLTWCRDMRRQQPDGMVGMAVIGPGGLSGPYFLSAIAGRWPFGSTGFPRVHLAYAGGLWYFPFVNLGAPPSEPGPARGVYVASFDAAGERQPKLILPGVVSDDVWGFSHGDVTDVFWTDIFSPWYAPSVEFGPERQRVNYDRLEGSSVGPIEEVYKNPALPRWDMEDEYRVLHVGADRYDMIFVRDDTDPRFGWAPNKLMYVQDLLGPRNPRREKSVAEVYFYPAVIPLCTRGQRIQLLWLEEVPEVGEKVPMSSTRAQLAEAHFDGKAWSKPRVLADQFGWTADSFAATTLSLDGQEAVLAIWQDEHDWLTYTIWYPPDQWSLPVNTSLKIGDRNWLACSDGNIVLVTQIGSELRWCRLQVRREGA